MKKFAKFFCLALMVAVMPCCLLFAGCSNTPVAVKSIDYTESQGLKDIYTITYTDGTTGTLVITNGRDGNDGAKGEDGENGKDGTSFSVTDAYNEYKKLYPDATYEDFLRACVTAPNDGNAVVVARCLLSAVKLFADTKTTQNETNLWGQVVSSTDTWSRSGGSGAIYKIEDEYTYIITNYHVVYNEKANEDNGGYIASRIVGYLYGSESVGVLKTDAETGETIYEDGYPVYDYGKFGIEMEFVGGSAEKDIAVIRAKTADMLAINPQIMAVEFASDYHVGETAIAVGNPEGQGISVSEGVVSVDSESVYLDINGTRLYRSMRIDTAIYEGSSGGGLFNASGELIGITNSGDTADQNINYAVPLDIVKNTVENIMYYYQDGDEQTQNAYKVYLGLTVQIDESKYVYDEDSGYGNIVEKVSVLSIEAESIVSKMNILEGDQILSIYIGADSDSLVEYKISRSFELGDLLLTVREGDTIKFKLSRTSGDTQNTVYSSEYVIQASDLVALI